METSARPRLTCEDVIALLVDYLETTLTPAVVEALEAHLAVCPPCVAYLNTYKKAQELTGTVGRVEMPEEMRARLRDILLQHLERGDAGS